MRARHLTRWICLCLLAPLILAGCGDDDGRADPSDAASSSGASSSSGDASSSSSGDASSSGASSSSGDASSSGDTSSSSGPDVPPDGAPQVISTDPADGAVDVARTAAVSVVFDQPIDPTTLTADAWQFTPPISGQYLWSEETLTATFQPNVLWLEQTAYAVTLTPALRDAQGEALEVPFTFGFTTSNAAQTSATSVYRANGASVVVDIDDVDSDTRAYTLNTNAALRDDDPPDKQVTFSELPGQLRVRTQHQIFDALFAMAIDETRANSVSQISDFAFNGGAGVACECFETGAKWNYVWTRDTAYAVDLALAFVDPARSQASLDFKLSTRKDTGADLQIVQDTGSGGSYPVSTDRVVWALGALETLKFLDGPERDAFRDRAYDAIVNTIAQDREMVWDSGDGLYHGEQSFLDWREQSYPSWTATEVVHIGQSKSLSTNVAHFIILSAAADLASERGEAAAASQHQAQADALAAAIRDGLWLDDAGQFSAFKTTALDPSPVHKFDLLGSALAVLHGVADPAMGAEHVAGFPRSVMGSPVLWPQQPLTPIYHNRGLWPFVSSYSLLAARAVDNDAVFDHELDSLIRGAALNLSNMENFEFTSHAPWYEDGGFSGPIVNSRRQLWSVAGYISAVVKGVFGVEALDAQTLRFRPFVTTWQHENFFADASVISLHDYEFHGKRLQVDLALPPLDPAGRGAYLVGEIFLNGESLGGDQVTLDLLDDSNQVLITLLANPASVVHTANVVTDTSDYRALWSPRDPTLDAVVEGGGLLELTFGAGGETSEVTFNVFRDGVEVASALTGPTWTDPDSGDFASHTYCYAIESVFTTSGHRSQHSRPLCYWGAGDARVQSVSAYGLRNSGGVWSTDHGAAHFGSWGAPQDQLEIPYFRPNWSGDHLVQLVYGNGAGVVSTGITAGVKTVIITEVESGVVVTQRATMMPHLSADGDEATRWAVWGDSSMIQATLDASKVYQVTIVDGVNMSYFSHFTPYTGGHGGGDTPYNNVNIQGVKFLPMDGVDMTPSTGDLVAFDGVDDLNKFDAAQQQLSPGAPLQAWDLLGLTWDEDYLYIALATEAFESPYSPWHLYIEGAQGSFSPATPTQGIDYDGVRPELAFTPTHLIAARQLSDDGNAVGPWNGILTPDGAGGWSHQQRFEPGVDAWLAADNHTISLRVPRIALGSPDRLRLAAHVWHQPSAGWRDTLPASHDPGAAGGGGYYEIDLAGSTATASWVEN